MERPRAGARRGWAVVAAATLLLGLLVFWRAAGRPVAPARLPGAVVHAEGAAVWSERHDGAREEVVLERGDLWVHVDHATGAGGLLVLLPDGELEDIGTTFRVGADEGRTTGVSVEEGHVVLRLRGRPAVTLGPGERWSPDVPATVASLGPQPRSPPAPVAPPAGEPSGARPASPSSSVALRLAPDPSADFRAAMGALDVGDNHEAAIRFASFLAKHPRDPRAEDAAYLRVIALQRAGDDGATRAAAAEYVRRYPSGFRRAEMEALSR